MIKRTQILTLTIIALTALTVLAAETVSVIVKKTSIREDSKFYATAVGEAAYKDELLVLSKKKDWIKVDRKGKEGWIHLSAVSPITAAASSSGSEVSSEYSSEEIALAGKGFSEQVEEQYRQDNPGLDFVAVDEIEKFTVAPSKVLAFQTEGKLIAKESTP